ncbi:MAG: hypothetical protein AB7U83_05155 [Vicinamibacterales bacterium]
MAVRPLRLVAWLLAFVAAVAAAVAIAVYLVLPRTGLSPAPRDWTAEWRADPPVVETIPGGLLETATLRMGEDFYRSDARHWWGIYLGNTVSHIQVAATYRYGVPLDDRAWEVITRGQTTVVVAPYLRPSFPVSIDTGTWREKTENGWARFDKQEQLDELRRSISADLEERAKDPKRVSLAREASRRTIAEFVEKWLLTKDPEWTPGAFTAVKVYFLNELDEGLSSELGAIAPRAPSAR